MTTFKLWTASNTMAGSKDSWEAAFHDAASAVILNAFVNSICSQLTIMD